jgi:predicted nuclease of predicted toxin-antitoxin system
VTVTRKQRNRPRIRLIWDELLARPVPKALRVLGFNVTWVGAGEDGAPPPGSPDSAVIEFAQRTGQVIVTSNHDMMTLCHESGQPFVWIDPRGRKLNGEAQVLLVFQQISQWEQLLTDAPGWCVVARRTGCKAIPSSEAARLAYNRMRALERKKRSGRRRQVRPGEPLPDEG